MTADDERQWVCQVGLGSIAQFNDQLNEHLEPYTTGTARAIVDVCGELNALDAWRLSTE